MRSKILFSILGLLLTSIAIILAHSYIEERFFAQPETTETQTSELADPYIISIDEIAGQPAEMIASLLGEPTATQQVNPSNTPCPCIQNIYKDGAVEIVFINDQADWITVNRPYKAYGQGDYTSVDQFDDYDYVKVTTP